MVARSGLLRALACRPKLGAPPSTSCCPTDAVQRSCCHGVRLGWQPSSSATTRRQPTKSLSSSSRSRGGGSSRSHRAAAQASHRLVRLEGSEGDIVAYLSGALGQKVLVGLHTSPPRANRKPILHLLTPSGDSIGFAKVGVDQLTRELVSHEAATLRMLSTPSFRSFEVPELLHHGTWNGLEVLVQSPLLRGDRTAGLTRVHEAIAS